MRVEYHAAADVDRSPALRSYAETRVWLAVRRAARGAGRGRPTWAGVTVTRRDGGAGRPEVACQVDAWLRGVGLVTVRHSGEDTRDVIECASVRLGRAIRRRFAKLTRRVWPRKDGGGTPADDRMRPPRLAVLVKPLGVPSLVGVRRWLAARHSIEEFQSVTLTEREWDALTSGGADAAHGERLKDRLALSSLCLPELVVVLGRTGKGTRARQQVERAVGRIRSLGVPATVIGIPPGGHPDAADGAIECDGVRRQAAGAAPADGRTGGRCGAWLAERTWEDDGGGNVAVIDPGPASPGRHAVKSWATRNGRTTGRRRRHADRHRAPAAAQAGD